MNGDRPTVRLNPSLPIHEAIHVGPARDTELPVSVATLDALETAVNAWWGHGQFCWTIVGTGVSDDPKWAWYCGTNDTGKGWRHSGLASTIAEALWAMYLLGNHEEDQG